MKCITVDADAIAEIVRCTSAACLDLQSGELIKIDQCPDSETGEGRSGVRAGKRFIVVPPLDEIVAELSWQNDKLYEGSQSTTEMCGDNAPLATDLATDEDCEECSQWLRFCSPEHARQEAAMNWLRCLRLPYRIDWLEPHLGVTAVLEPGTNEWIDAI